ncbi:DUF6384 family protein [Pseudomonas sp. zfem002]|uniref:DUF6384 family protein n=1 Tax=Pseudomonas sp. zfem002 TaxID=3078197 RepID=UPI002928B84B|nr:DUF6384 family protein [Pseudomonas sp. zfem002]MDU9389664.1 DUF6384 family protein [Pseudomonas sp. zfem002]
MNPQPPAGKAAPLSETLGAMSVVDELRWRQARIEEHLDLPRRRAEIANNIRAYYQSHGIPFDDALVEQGVREFFSRRLVYEAPRLSGFKRYLCRLITGQQ